MALADLALFSFLDHHLRAHPQRSERASQPICAKKKDVEEEEEEDFFLYQALGLGGGGGESGSSSLGSCTSRYSLFLHLYLVVVCLLLRL